MTASQPLSSNIWKLHVDKFIGSFMVFTPILVPYYVSCGLGATQIFTIQSVFSATICLLEIPTGHLSDMLGRKITFILAAMLFPVGIALYVGFQNYWAFIAAEIILAICYSLRSGTDTAFLYDTLRAMDRNKEHKKIEGTRYFVSQISTALANISGGLLGAVSLKWPFYARMVSTIPMLLVALSLKEPPRPQKPRQSMRHHVQDMANAVRSTSAHPQIRAISIYSAAITGIGLVGIWSYYLLYTRQGLSTTQFGLLTAAFYVLNGLGGKLAHRIEKSIGEKATLALPLLTGINLAVIGAIHNVYAAVPFILLNGFLWGLFMPLMRDIVHRNTPTARRATTLSVISVAERLTFVVISIISGYIADNASLNGAYYFMGASFLALSLPAFAALKNGRDSP